MPPKPTYEELENRVDTLERLLGVASLDGHAETDCGGFDDTMPEAPSDAKPMDLASIVDVDAIQALMDDFFKLTRIGVAIIDMKGVVLVATGWQDICVDFHRLHRETARNCIESDLKLSNGVAPGTFRLYRCKNNMWDMATPILAGNRKVGNLFLGQFLFEDEEPDVEVFRNQARTYGFDETAYLEALRRVPRWSRGTVETVMAFYTKLAHLISEMGYRNLLLQKSEEKFRNLFESSFEGIAESDLEGQLVSCNSAYARMTGYTQEELKRLRYQDLTPPKWADIDKGHILQCLERGYSDIYEKERIRKDGQTIPVAMRIWLRKDSQGKPVGFWGIVQDISDRKQSENALRESESRFRSFVENANDIVYALSPEGTFTYVSPNWSDFVGEPAEAAVGQSFEHYVHPEDVRLCRRFLEKVLGTGEKQSRVEYRVKHRDGSWRWHVSNGSPIGDADGKIAGYMGIARDVTDRKTAETALNESRQMLQSIMDNIGIGVALISPNMEILALNRQMMKWFPEIDPAARPICYRAFNNPPRDEICEYCPTVKTLRDGRVHEDTTRTPRGEATVHYRIVSSPIRDATDRVTAVIEMVEDVTEEIRLAQHISQVQKMESIGNLAAGIAHDFNNILSPILGMSEMLLEDLPAGGMAHENVREIFDAGKRAQELVRQILTFSRQSEHKTIPVGIQKILREVLRLCRRTIPSDIEISFDVQNDCGLVRADPTHIHQVCMNLITNAYHAVENNGGKIAVSLYEADLPGEMASEGGLAPGRHAVLTVSDTGAGIDPGIVDKIFEPYFTTKETGTGLGLATVYGIVKEHGGEIKVHSELGRGSRFAVYLSLIERKPGAAAFQQANTCYPTGDERILLIDDDEAVVRLERQMLERLGYRVTACHGSVDARKLFCADPSAFDLVVTDMTMPQLTGDRLARAMIATRPDIPVIICTGFSERIDEKRAHEIGIKGFLMKPVIRSQLAAMVRNVLDASRNRSG